MNAAELVSLLADAEVRRDVQGLLGLPTEPIANALRELAAAQARTDATVERLSQKVEELAAAQARTEATVKDLAAAQARTDATVKELAAAQARTDATVKELAAAQARTEAAIERLVEAQMRTEAGLLEVRKALGALSDNVGFGLEELAAIVLPGVLEREAGVQVGGFERRFLQTDEGEEEIDLFAGGTRQSERVTVVGEVKSRIYRGEVERFARKAERVARRLPEPIVAVMFGFVVHPSAREAAERLGVRVVASRPAA
jgi:hypothetical protein